MKKVPLTLLFFTFFTLKIFAQSYQLTVVNGYGSGNYTPGDTVHIWSSEWAFNQTFKNWTGQTTFLEDAGEWHTRVIMPAQAVTVTANIRNLPAGADFSYELMRGRDTLKRVFYYFPQGVAPKGVVWLAHGSDGSANAWVNVQFEQRQFVNYLMADTIAVVVTECEEVTYNTDSNGDGNQRWFYLPDSINNVDIANYRAFRDTFINRGWITPNTPHAAVGFSAGGAFSTLVAAVLQWRAGISHCAPGPDIIIPTTTTPLAYSMNMRDVNGSIPDANIRAYGNYQDLIDRGICSDYHLLRPSPVYPERFKRLTTISGAMSESFFNELKNNGCLNAQNYLTKGGNAIVAQIANEPANWPTALAFTNQQSSFVKDQIDVMWTAHQFHTDFMAAELRFLKLLCGMPVSTGSPQEMPAPGLFPNPAHEVVQFSENVDNVQVFDVQGRLVLSANAIIDRQLDISVLDSGLYFVHLQDGDELRVCRLVKF